MKDQTSAPTLTSQMLRDIANRFSHKIRRRQDKPWMKTKELDVILEVLLRANPARCLEWGGGLSTLYFPDKVGGLKSWLTIEHHKEWHQFISSRNTDPRVNIQLVEPDDSAYTTTKHQELEKREGRYDDFRSYIEFCNPSQYSFDFIFIDGRARKECLKKSLDLLSDDGTVIVHDANRDYYFTELPPFSSSVRLTDYRKPRKCGGIWIGRKNGSVNDILDVNRHTELWRSHDRLAKILFLR